MERKERRKRVIEPTAENAEQLGAELGKRIGAIGDAAVEQINALTERFGVKAKIQVVLINSTTGQPLIP